MLQTVPPSAMSILSMTIVSADVDGIGLDGGLSSDSRGVGARQRMPLTAVKANFALESATMMLAERSGPLGLIEAESHDLTGLKSRA